MANALLCPRVFCFVDRLFVLPTVPSEVGPVATLPAKEESVLPRAKPIPVPKVKGEYCRLREGGITHTLHKIPVPNFIHLFCFCTFCSLYMLQESVLTISRDGIFCVLQTFARFCDGIATIVRLRFYHVLHRPSKHNLVWRRVIYRDGPKPGLFLRAPNFP